MAATVTVLVHSPLTGPEAWGALPSVLRERGHEVAVVDVRDDDGPPYAQRFVARAAVQLRDAVGARPAVLVGHSGAGYLLPLIGSARRAARATVAGYLFVDAGLPPVRPASRLQLMRAEDQEFAEQLEAQLRAGVAFPDWSDDDLEDLVPDDDARRALVTSLRPRGSDFFVEDLPVAPDWPDAPCGYLRLSSSYDRAARSARQRGWPVLDGPDTRPGGHFAAVAAPSSVAHDLDALLARL